VSIIKHHTDCKVGSVQSLLDDINHPEALGNPNMGWVLVRLCVLGRSILVFKQRAVSRALY
jgi:hypothetical protein